MTKYCLAACLLLILSGISCTPAQQKDASDTETDVPIVISDKTTLLRKGVEDNLYRNPADCEKKAKEYFDKHIRTGAFTPSNTNPLIYSFKKDPLLARAREIRFTVNDTIAKDFVIIYYEIKQRSENQSNADNGRDIKEAFEDLKAEGDIGIQDPVPDANETNGKKSWRAILKRSENIAKANPLLLRGEYYGIIINPPYP